MGPATQTLHKPLLPSGRLCLSLMVHVKTLHLCVTVPAPSVGPYDLHQTTHTDAAKETW